MIKLIKGDFEEKSNIVGNNSVDTIIIDPPFSGNNSKAKNGSGGRFQNSLIMNDDMSERAFYNLMKPVFRECYHKMKEGGHLYCFSDWKQLRNMMDCVESGSLKLINLIC